MARKRNTFKLGLAVIVMFALAVAAVLFVGGQNFFQPQPRMLVVRFEPIAGMPQLGAGSFVVYLGQQVGKVVTTRFIEDVDPKDPLVTDRPFLEVYAQVRADIGLRDDCQVIASAPPLGGKGIIEIADRGKSEQPLAPETPVYGKTTGFAAAIESLNKELNPDDANALLTRVKFQLNPNQPESLMAKIHVSADNLGEITASLRHELDAQQQDVILVKLHAAVDGLNKFLSDFGALLAENRPRIDNTLKSMEHASGTLDTEVIAVLAQQLEWQPAEGQADLTLLAKIHQAFDQLNTSLDDLNVTTHEAERVMLLNGARLDELIENATEASMHLRTGIKDLALHPWKLLATPTETKRGELMLLNVAREFAEAAAHLDDATTRLTSLTEARKGNVTTDDPDLEVIRADLSAAIERFSAAERALWDRLGVK